MARTLSDHLLNTLEELVPYDFEKFKFKLQNTSLEKEHSRIPRGHLQMARPVKLATLMITHYGEEYAVRLTLQVLRAINQRLLAEELHRATGQEYPTQEGGTSTSTGSSPENKLKSLEVADGPEGDEVVGSLSRRPEAGRGPQKKSQGKRRDQKDPEGPDLQSKPCLARGTAPVSRKSPIPTQPLGDKEGTKSARLRRNASSAGRLQGLCSGNLGRRESKKWDVCLPSGKQRPKSLEITISSEEGKPLNPQTLLTQEEIRNANPDSAATPTVDERTNSAPEKGSGNPEHSMVLAGGIFRNLLSNASLPEEKKCTASWEERGIEGPGIPEMVKKAASDVLCKSSNPEVPSSSNEKGAQSPEDPLSIGMGAYKGRPQDEATCPCHTQERSVPSGTCMHSSYSCTTAPGDAETSSNHSSSCPQCQALPQCPRHMKQVQLLFCEDHGEPICLICRLSQEHRGHQVRPIEEVALEYRGQIQKQLEHLKEMRRSGEEQRLHGNKKAESFLKQTETQKQRVQCQVEKLWEFLKQQEQHFVAWLEELGQTIGQVEETYSTRVSQDIALLDEMIGELEAKQGQSQWELMQDIGATLHRAKMMTVPEPWITPPYVKEKIHMLYQKSEFVEKSIQYFSEALRYEMETFSVPELSGAQAHAVSVIMDPATAHPNLIFSDDMKSVRLGSKWDRLPNSPERFESCIITLGSPSFISGRHYWEVEVGDKTAWILGACRTSTSRKGSMTLSPENGYWVVMMTKRNEYQASTLPPTRLPIREPPRRVGIFLDHVTGFISFYNVTARSHIYTFSGFSSSGPLQPIFSPGTHDGGKNVGPLTICPVDNQELH